MFTRIVELTAKTGKQRELTRVVDDKVVPILKKQTGFVDEIVLVSDTEPDHVVSVSFWKRREDAEQYHQKEYAAIREMVRPLLETDPVIGTFNVNSSTTHKIAAGKAA
jgi:quinol monooxygenase YgiN